MGAVYETGEQLAGVISELGRQLMEKPEIRETFTAAGVTVKFELTDPDCNVVLDPKADPIVQVGDGDTDVSLSMSADFMHDFWLGKTDIIKSIGNGDIVITLAPHIEAVKMVDLLPLLLPGLDIYPSLI